MTSQTDAKIYFQKAAGEIEKELKKFSKDWNAQTKELPELKEPTTQFTKSFFGGKMLRGTLVKLGYELVQTKPIHAIFKPACAFEVLHTALLIHDDIIDKSPTRRGRPAMHMIYKDQHYGTSLGICLGDLGIVLAFKLISQSDFPTDRKNKALTYFSQMIEQTILGEMLDVQSAHSLERKEKQILTIHKMKTANYTIVGPLTVGAILAGATDDLLENITVFGQNLGVAYQIQDDILGIFGDEKAIGKSTSSDMEENKSTLLITYGLAHSTKEQTKILKKYYGRKGITSKQQEMVKKVLVQTGALTYSQNKITKLTTKAKAVISQLTKNPTQQEMLIQFADSLIERNK